MELRAERTEVKSGRFGKRRALEFPFAGHAVGIRGTPWARQWLEAREEVGLNADADGTLMPAPMPGGGFAARTLEADEAAAWLRELLLRAGRPLQEISKVGTHGIRATLLSWAAKSGMPPASRRLLGGHAKAKDKSVLEYSRDALAGPLRQLGGVISKVSAGEF